LGAQRAPQKRFAFWLQQLWPGIIKIDASNLSFSPGQSLSGGFDFESGPSEAVAEVLYPQPKRRQPSVEYVPLPYRSKRDASPQR
jgi:hypothetical protein